MKKDTKLILIVLAGILAIVLLCIFAVQGTQNKAFTLEEQVNTAQSDIRVQEKRRVDLVYNLADCVMQYDKHEAETLTAIVEGRGSSGDISVKLLFQFPNLNYPERDTLIPYTNPVMFGMNTMASVSHIQEPSLQPFLTTLSLIVVHFMRI